MANLSIRNLNDRVYEKLRLRAVDHGLSMEEEVRKIIAQAVSTPDKMSEVFRKHFGAHNGIDLNLQDHSKPHEPMNFNE